MKVKAGEWRKKSFIDKADELIYASNNNVLGYLLRQSKGEVKWIIQQ